MSTSNSAINFSIRGTQALFSMIVFGLACTLIKGHYLGSLPSALSFTAFVGGLSFICALLGVASHWMSALQGHLGLLIDSAIAGVNLAGGLVCFLKRQHLTLALPSFAARTDVPTAHGDQIKRRPM